MIKSPEIPKDLGVKIGSKAEVMWQAVKDNVVKEIEGGEITLIINRSILKLAESKIADEKAKLKS